MRPRDGERVLPGGASGLRIAGLGLVDLQAATFEILTVKGLDGRIGLGVVIHLHKSETARLAGLAVGDEFDGGDGAVLGEKITDVVFRGPEGQI